MDNRVKALRKELGMTQQEFATKLSVKRGAIANYEVGRNAPTDSVVSLMCRVFNVNETWLRTGEGEMFNPPDSDEKEIWAKQFPNLTKESLILVEKFSKLTEAQQGVVMDFIKDVAKKLDEEDEAKRLHAELDRQIELEKRWAEESGGFCLQSSAER